MLQVVDVSYGIGGHSRRVKAYRFAAGVDQDNADAVGYGYGTHREFRYIAQCFGYVSSTGDDSSHTGQPRVQVQLIGFELCGGQMPHRW